MNTVLTSKDYVKVDNIYYKPFWFNNFMYFVDLSEGIVYSHNPIYLGDRKYANRDNLVNYFQNNNITIISSLEEIKLK